MSLLGIRRAKRGDQVLARNVLKFFISKYPIGWAEVLGIALEQSTCRARCYHGIHVLRRRYNNRLSVLRRLRIKHGDAAMSRQCRHFANGVQLLSERAVTWCTLIMRLNFIA